MKCSDIIVVIVLTLSHLYVVKYDVLLRMFVISFISSLASPRPS